MDFGVADFNVAAILERIIALLTVIGDANVLAVHEQIIGPLDTHVFQRNAAAMPQRFLSIGQFDIRQLQILHFAEHLRGLDARIGHPQSARIPKRSASPLGKKTIAHDESVVVPERVLSLEATTDRFDVAALFERRFTCMNGDIFQPEIARSDTAARLRIPDSRYSSLFRLFLISREMHRKPTEPEHAAKRAKIRKVERRSKRQLDLPRRSIFDATKNGITRK